MMLPDDPLPEPYPESSGSKSQGGPEVERSHSESTETGDGLRPLEVATELLCPRCNTTLRGGMLDQFPVAFCPDCHGVLIDNQGIGNVIAIRRSEYQGADQTPKPFDPQALEVHGNCPNCGEKMEVYPFGGPGNVVMDGCRTCHMVWLDNGEISAIVQAPGLRHD